MSPDQRAQFMAMVDAFISSDLPSPAGITSWIANWTDASSRPEVAQWLLKNGYERSGFQFVWLRQSLEGCHHLYAAEHWPDLLREVFNLQCDCRQSAAWSDYAAFGFLPHQLQLKRDADQHFLGDTLVNRYQLDERVAQGGFATVYRALDLQHQLEVAVKVPLVREAAVPVDITQQFEMEALCLKALSNSSAAPHLIDVFSSPWGQVLVTEFIAGETLADRMRRQPLSMQALTDTLSKVAAAVEDLHVLGILHGDIKPGNIMLGADGSVKLLDFNSARWDHPFALLAESSHGLTTSYASELNLRGIRPRLDSREDVHALGMTLYQGLVAHKSRNANEQETVGDDYSQFIATKRLTFPLHTPPGVRKVCEIATAPVPERRFDTVGLFRQACQQLASGDEQRTNFQVVNQESAAWQCGAVLGESQYLVKEAQHCLEACLEDPSIELFKELSERLLTIDVLPEQFEERAGNYLERWNIELAPLEVRVYRQPFDELVAAGEEGAVLLQAILTSTASWFSKVEQQIITELLSADPYGAGLLALASGCQQLPWSHPYLPQAELLKAKQLLPDDIIDRFYSVLNADPHQPLWRQAVLELNYLAIRYLRWGLTFQHSMGFNA